MADQAAGSGLKKKVGGQPVWAWAAEGVGVFVIYRWWSGRNAAAAGLGTTSGPGTGGSGDTGTGSTTGTTGPTDWASWLAAALDAGTYTSSYSKGQFYNDLTNWINGSCVSPAGFNAITGAIGSLGAPPGFGVTPAVNVCPQTSTTGTQTATGAPTPSRGVPSIFTPISSGTVAEELLAKGYYIVRFGNGLYYNPGQKPVAGKGGSYQWISNPALAKELEQAGYQVVQIGSGLYYNPQQRVSAAKH
jgi:hypothetical protein